MLSTFGNADLDATCTKMDATINTSTNMNIISCAFNYKMAGKKGRQHAI